MTESKKSTKTLKDVLGRKIEYNDTVAYPVRRRSTIALFTATVMAFTPEGHLLCIKDGSTTQVRLRHPSRCVVVRRINEE